MTHEEMIMLHHEDIKKAKEMLKNIPKDLDAVFKRLDTLEGRTENIFIAYGRIDTLEYQMKAQIEFYEGWIKLFEEANNG